MITPRIHSGIKKYIKANKFYLYLPLELLLLPFEKTSSQFKCADSRKQATPTHQNIFNLLFDSYPEFYNLTRLYMPNEALWNENKETIMLCISPL